ncbi:MAG: alpha/beta hydrolase [Pseudomonadota bacterium]
MRSYFGEGGAQIHARIHGQGTPCLFLPPAPHTGAYFEAMIPHLDSLQMIAVDYPGYGGSDRAGDPSIETYAEVIAPHVQEDAVLVGFHTGNLVAAEIARQTPVAGIVMIDVPWFDAETRAAYAKKLPGTRLPTPVRGSFAKAVDGRHESVGEGRAFQLWVETLRSGAHQSDAFHAACAYNPVAGP